MEEDLGVTSSAPGASTAAAKLEDLCRALCSGLDMRPVPIGYAIKTPFRHEDGDSIGVYLRRNPDDSRSLRFEDDGATIASLEESGVSLASESRQEALVSLLKQYGAQYDYEGAIIFTEYFPEDRAPANFAKFLALMLRVAWFVNYAVAEDDRG